MNPSAEASDQETPTAKEPLLADFVQRSDKALTSPQIIKRAWSISQAAPWQPGLVLNKHIRMAKRLRAAHSKEECFAILSGYFALTGVSKPLINLLVNQLGELDLACFQALVSRLLVFYNADSSTSARSRSA